MVRIVNSKRVLQEEISFPEASSEAVSSNNYFFEITVRWNLWKCRHGCVQTLITFEPFDKIRSGFLFWTQNLM